MLGRFRSAIYSAISPLEEEGVGEQGTTRQSSPLARPTKQKYAYQRPAFLKLATEDEIQVPRSV